MTTTHTFSPAHTELHFNMARPPAAASSWTHGPIPPPTTDELPIQLSPVSAIHCALQCESFIAFIQTLRSAGCQFYVNGIHLGVRHERTGSLSRLGTLGLLQKLLRQLSDWDAFDYGFELTPDVSALLQLRLGWLAENELKLDFSNENLRSVHYFIHLLGIEQVNEAMGIAQRKIPAGNPDDRFRYFCGVCHSKRRERGLTTTANRPSLYAGGINSNN